MKRRDLILAALAAAGQGAGLTPVQVQKLFFLIDREASHLFGGPHFAFKPYDYGPFDRDVYLELDQLQVLGMSRIETVGRVRQYILSEAGYSAGRSALGGLSEGTQRYLSDLSNWVVSLSFQQLVAAVYKRHPDMKANSIFKE